MAVAFTKLLGFQLLLQLKRIGKKRLCRSDAAQAGAYPHIALVLTRPNGNLADNTTTRWSSVPPRFGWARRRRKPSCAASSAKRPAPDLQGADAAWEAVKTVFLARDLHDRALRAEINDERNVIEQWNLANGFIFLARRGEVSSHRREDQEASLLSPRLLQNCIVYVNTLMIQTALARPKWKGRLTTRDLHALTPLLRTHVNPCGRFNLDMHTRITILAGPEAAANGRDVGSGRQEKEPPFSGVVAAARCLDGHDDGRDRHNAVRLLKQS